jgi:hypothetical protein
LAAAAAAETQEALTMALEEPAVEPTVVQESTAPETEPAQDKVVPKAPAEPPVAVAELQVALAKVAAAKALTTLAAEAEDGTAVAVLTQWAVAVALATLAE